MLRFAFGLALVLVLPAASAAPVTFELDPSHTYPSFEADHMGVSKWRGKFNRNAGTVVLDREAGTGTVEVTVDIASVDFGHDGMNEHALKPDIFNAEAHPQARFAGKLEGFVDGAPTRAPGELTLLGITQPLTLEIRSFTCKQHPRHGREFCGADVFGSFERDQWGLTAGQAYGFDMTVDLRIQVEASARPE